jgi:putative NADPH-quinone reductase
MTKRVLIIQGHPDPTRKHFCHALAEAYAAGARREGHEVRTIDVANLSFDLLQSQDQFRNEAPCEAIRDAQKAINWADHLVFCFPLWLGTLPALLKGFLEQTFREGFAMKTRADGHGWTRMLKGKSARIVVTMGMPAFFYRWYFGAHGVKCLKRSILKFAGIRPIRESLIGLVESRGTEYRGRWLIAMERLGGNMS